jgi:hypothetical protein
MVAHQQPNLLGKMNDVGPLSTLASAAALEANLGTIQNNMPAYRSLVPANYKIPFVPKRKDNSPQFIRDNRPLRERIKDEMYEIDQMCRHPYVMAAFRHMKSILQLHKLKVNFPDEVGRSKDRRAAYNRVMTNYITPILTGAIIEGFKHGFAVFRMVERSIYAADDVYRQQKFGEQASEYATFVVPELMHYESYSVEVVRDPKTNVDTLKVFDLNGKEIKTIIEFKNLWDNPLVYDNPEFRSECGGLLRVWREYKINMAIAKQVKLRVADPPQIVREEVPAINQVNENDFMRHQNLIDYTYDEYGNLQYNTKAFTINPDENGVVILAPRYNTVSPSANPVSLVNEEQEEKKWASAVSCTLNLSLSDMMQTAEGNSLSRRSESEMNHHQSKLVGMHQMLLDEVKNIAQMILHMTFGFSESTIEGVIRPLTDPNGILQFYDRGLFGTSLTQSLASDIYGLDVSKMTPKRKAPSLLRGDNKKARVNTDQTRELLEMVIDSLNTQQASKNDKKKKKKPEADSDSESDDDDDDSVVSKKDDKQSVKTEKSDSEEKNKSKPKAKKKKKEAKEKDSDTDDSEEEDDSDEDTKNKKKKEAKEKDSDTDDSEEEDDSDEDTKNKKKKASKKKKKKDDTKND